MNDTGPPASSNQGYLVFTDLDGSLLDHFNYSAEPALPVLGRLEKAGIPVIFNSSKTAAEQLQIRGKLGNRHPFITENGAGVFIPRHYFPGSLLQEHPAGFASFDDDYLYIALGEDRDHWLSILDSIRPGFTGCFTGFAEMSIEDIMQATGLDQESAMLASRRQFSEPLLWHGSEAQKRTLTDRLHALGAKTLQGGRFLHVGGQTDKGQALAWLSRLYELFQKQNCTAIAAGDSGNDIAMLEAADIALVVRSPVHEPPTVNAPRTMLTNATGPAGWAEGINKLVFSHEE